MSNFDFWNFAFERRWANINQLHQAVRFKEITVEEFEQITGEAYST